MAGRVYGRTSALLAALIIVTWGSVAVSYAMPSGVVEVLAIGPEVTAPGDLVVASEEAPFELRLPRWLPEGTEVQAVTWVRDQGDDPGLLPSMADPPFAADVFYEGDGFVLHIWQTNLSVEELGAKDPLRGPSRTHVELAGTTWIVKDVWYLGGAELSTRTEDGITIALDSALDLDILVKIAESIPLSSDAAD